MVYDSYGNGLRLKNIPGYDTVLVNTAKSLSTRFRPNAGIIQSWNVVGNGWQSHRGWKCPVFIVRKPFSMIHLPPLIFMISGAEPSRSVHIPGR